MTLTQPLVAFGVTIVLILAIGYGGYKFLSIALEGKPSPLKTDRFEAGNIPTGEGRLWFPLQYYGYLLIYTTLEPIIVLLFLASSALTIQATYYLLFLVGALIIVLYPVINYAIRQINTISYWELRR
ncbi:NADH-quinone oxidoreductase subunit A [Sulfodiicoccus acidiphilus]|nr:NADH-quinone oxidoreductase subunit A [Sulfodiicoccus acidiphilus]